MDVAIYNTPLDTKRAQEYSEFLQTAALRDEGDLDAVAWLTDDNGRLAATGALAGHTIKQIAVAPWAEGQGLMASVMTALIGEASERGIFRLFLCTKPDNRRMLSSMGFYPVIETYDAILMENRRNGAGKFIDSLPRHEGLCGAVVCKCDPFTLGHRHLIEHAAARCDSLYVFAVSESGTMFTPAERLDMIRKGTADIANCCVYESDLYLVSRATFPAYFIKDEARSEEVKSDLDIEFFASRLAPALGITVRFVGEEPLDPVTRAYNERMKQLLPMKGIRLEEIPRISLQGQGNEDGLTQADVISARKVREAVRALEAETEDDRRLMELSRIELMVPDTTYEIIKSKCGADASRP